MKWVTWEHVGVDRMACAWLLKRFVDENACFSFVPTGFVPTELAVERDLEPTEPTNTLTGGRHA